MECCVLILVSASQDISKSCAILKIRSHNFVLFLTSQITNHKLDYIFIATSMTIGSYRRRRGGGQCSHLRLIMSVVIAMPLVTVVSGALKVRPNISSSSSSSSSSKADDTNNKKKKYYDTLQLLLFQKLYLQQPNNINTGTGELIATAQYPSNNQETSMSLIFCMVC